jgi:3-oxoacyl-[acyl-carrier-protein] synthase-3
MYIHSLSEYVPEKIVDNKYFGERAGRPSQWYERLTGMKERRRAQVGENTNTMALAAVARLVETHPGALDDVDLIVGGSYTPWDTIATIAHVVQRKFNLRKARALFISSACTSFLNAVELTAAYFESGRAKKALLVVSEHNSLYSSDDDPTSGHLWGDAAAAAVLTKDRGSDAFMSVDDVMTEGLGCVGFGPDGIHCSPRGGGLSMPQAKDVFAHACVSMENSARQILERNGLRADQMRLLIAHQANGRILEHVAERLELAGDRVANTLQTLGNTGCASIPITLFRHRHLLKQGDRVLFAAFGGGYSTGAALARVQ